MDKTNLTCIGTATPESPAADKAAMQTAPPEARDSAAPASRPNAAIDGDVIYVANAGLVLLPPFLPRMFQ